MRLSTIAFVFLTRIVPARGDGRFTGPWKMAKLKQAPVSEVSKAEPGSNIGLLIDH